MRQKWQKWQSQKHRSWAGGCYRRLAMRASGNAGPRTHRQQHWRMKKKGNQTRMQGSRTAAVEA